MDYTTFREQMIGMQILPRYPDIFNVDIYLFHNKTSYFGVTTEKILKFTPLKWLKMHLRLQYGWRKF